MKRATCAAVVAALCGSPFGAGLTAQQELDFLQDTKVILVLRDQLPNVPVNRHALAARSSGVATAQLPLVTELQQAGASRIHSFKLVNAISATVSKAEATRLASHPMVQAVVPDRLIHAIPREKAVRGALPQSGSSPSSPLCNTLEPEALQLTNTAFLDPNKPQAQRVRDGNGDFVTGKGVKVAFIADGIDPNVLGFTRPDGSKVFFDYQDFSGDPAGTPTDGAEAFGDASSIAAQDTPNGKPLLFDISTYVNPAHPLPAGCNIRVRGMAPGASLSGLKVFSSLGLTTTSAFVQAIEWAVVQDEVDVINESFGGNPFPDNDDDPVALANRAAVAAGVTITASTGDAGTAGTLGSPSTQSEVIAVGATTQYRVYAQTGQGIEPLLKGGYVSDNISPISSGGYAQRRARTIDVVAPGDLGWALCSTNAALFEGCANFAGGPTPIQDFGGTSQSSPFVAGAAALVIQAYRSTHRGTDPSPATVKQILMSTAIDLGAPAFEQGAGLINTLAAVNAAMYAPSPRSAGVHGEGIVLNPTQANAIDEPGSHQTRVFSVRNTGTSTQHLRPTLQKLGKPFAGQTLSLQLDPAHDPTYLNVTGSPRSYIKRTFNVPAGGQRLDVAIAFQTSPTPATGAPIAYLNLVDPQGRQVSYSAPQGFGSGYGHVDASLPAAGTWTAYISTRPSGVAGTYTGPVQLSWGVSRYESAGSVSPAQVDLAPGAAAMLTARFALPDEPGDSSAEIRFAPFTTHDASKPSEGLAAIPVTMRTLIPMQATGASFTGTLTGGNAREAAGPTQTFAFDVPRGVQVMSLTLQVPDNGYLLEGLLVDPTGMQMSVAPNLDPDGNVAQFALQSFRANPVPGRWKFVLLQNFTSSGNQTTVPFAARIGLGSASQYVAANLPNSAQVRLSASGSPVKLPVLVRNQGAVAQYFFADARLASLAAVELPTSPFCLGPKNVPLNLQGACSVTYLPTQVTAVRFSAQSSTPINMDAYNLVGYNVGGTDSPDIWARPTGPGAVAATLTANEVPWGMWVLYPSLIGPYGPAGAPTTQPVDLSTVALMQPFDKAVSASSGDAWADLTLGTNTFNPLLLAPGQTGRIDLTIKPDRRQIGQTVSGFLYIDTFNFGVFTGDEVVRVPYSYTVVP